MFVVLVLVVVVTPIVGGGGPSMFGRAAGVVQVPPFIISVIAFALLP